MSVGVGYFNRYAGIVAADRLITHSGTLLARQSATYVKLKPINTNFFHGALYASGSGIILEHLLRNGDFPLEAHLGQICAIANEKRLARVDGYVNWSLARHDEIRKRRDSFEHQETAQLTPPLSRKKPQEEKPQEERSLIFEDAEENADVDIIIEGFDGRKEEMHMRRFYLNEKGEFIEWFTGFHPSGSGADLAGAYKTLELSGANPDYMAVEDLLLHVMAAYACSMGNVGVGGTPSIVETTRDGTRLLERAESALVANIGAAYQARFLTFEEAQEATHNYRDLAANRKGKEKKLQALAGRLGLQPAFLLGAAVPLITWTEMQNYQRYPRRNLSQG